MEFKMTKQLIEKFGTTDECKGCEGLFTGSRRDHSAACRKRIEQKMADDEVLEGRLTARDARLGRDDEGDQRERGNSRAEVQGDVTLEAEVRDRGVKRHDQLKEEEETEASDESRIKRRRVDEAIAYVTSLINAIKEKK